MAVATQTVARVSKKTVFDARVRLGSRNRTTFWIVLGTLATVLSVAAAAAIQIRKDHALALEQIEREAKVFVAVSGVVVGSALDRAQETLVRVIAAAPGTMAISADPAIINVIATDLNGNVYWDRNGVPGEPRQLKDTALLQRLMAAQEGTRFIAGKFTDNEFGKSPLALAIRGQTLPQQLYVALIDPAYLTRMLENLQGSRRGSLVITDGHSRTIAGTAVDPTLLSVSISSLPASISTNPTLRYISGDGSNFLAAARLIPGYDLRLVSVARASDALSSWYDSMPLYSIMVFGPSLLGAALAWALLNQIEQTSRSDSALRRTEERFEFAVSGAKCGIWDWDLSQRRMYWSGAMNALLGRGKQPRIMELSEVDSLVHPDDRAIMSSIEAAARSGAQSYDESFRAQHADGHWVWIRAKGQAYRTIRSDSARLSGIVIDVSDQKSADARVSTAERVLQAAFEHAAEAFVLWDRDNKLLLCNKRFLEFYGLADAKVGAARATLMSRAVSADQSAAGQSPDLLDSRGATSTIDLQQAGNRWLLVSERRVLDGAKIMVATDITALKQQKDELQSSRNLLEAQTLKLGEIATTLEGEKTRAEEGSRSKSEFLANMSHELRTPLNAIIGFSDVMLNEMLGPMPGRYVEYATDIHRSGQHLLHLIDEVLNMARIESGGLSLELESVDIGLLVNEVVKSIEPKAQESQLSLRLNVAATPQVRADSCAVRDVLSNLLSNAIKFNAPSGFITVETRIDGDFVSVWIHDTGIGIAESNLSRVVKPFERLEKAANSNKRGGTGLGLAVSNALIEMHGGKLVLESEVGVGTSVYFTLPIASA
ncbi:MAG: ATP-binding protein [Alphaproteobacteria bacterium]|nr:ATP-binding protein [Alphaproteobacteria bacterium]